MKEDTANTAKNILLLSVQVPFTRGGAELLVERLAEQLRQAGHTVDIVALPFSAQPKENILRAISLWQNLDLSDYAGRKVDAVIATKFPSYFARHPHKVLWLIHQHRQLYELYGTRFGDFTTAVEDEALRRLLLQADEDALRECQSRFAISQNVATRLERYLGLNAAVLPPPLPLAGRYYRSTPKPYILSVGRLCSIKRVDLLVKALPMIAPTFSLKIVGQADEPHFEEYLQSEVRKHHLWNRLEFLGRVGDEELLRLYAEAFAVCYVPFDEDYGFVTLEALASGVPVVTAHDSGTVLNFVQHQRNGLVVEPTERDIAAGINRLVEETELYQRLRAGCDEVVEQSNWSEIINTLLFQET